MLLPHLAGCMDTALRLSRRCTLSCFLKMAMQSGDVVFRIIINMGIGRVQFYLGEKQNIDSIKIQ